MPMRKRTLRRMTPQARKLAKLVGELESVATRLKNLVGEVQSMEMWQRAEEKRQAKFGKPKEENTGEIFQENSSANQKGRRPPRVRAVFNFALERR